MSDGKNRGLFGRILLRGFIQNRDSSSSGSGVDNKGESVGDGSAQKKKRTDGNIPSKGKNNPASNKVNGPSQEVDLQDLEQRAILQVSGMTGMAELLTRMCAAADQEDWATFVFLASSYQTKGAGLEEILSLCGENQKFLSDHALYLRLLKISHLLKEQGIESDTAYIPERFPAETLKSCAVAILQNWRKKEGTKDET